MNRDEAVSYAKLMVDTLTIQQLREFLSMATGKWHQIDPLSQTIKPTQHNTYDIQFLDEYFCGFNLQEIDAAKAVDLISRGTIPAGMEISDDLGDYSPAEIYNLFYRGTHQ